MTATSRSTQAGLLQQVHEAQAVAQAAAQGRSQVRGPQGLCPASVRLRVWRSQRRCRPQKPRARVFPTRVGKTAGQESRLQVTSDHRAKRAPGVGCLELQVEAEVERLHSERPALTQQISTLEREVASAQDALSQDRSTLAQVSSAPWHARAGLQAMSCCSLDCPAVCSAPIAPVAWMWRMNCWLWTVCPQAVRSAASKEEGLEDLVARLRAENDHLNQQVGGPCDVAVARSQRARSTCCGAVCREAQLGAAERGHAFKAVRKPPPVCVDQCVWYSHLWQADGVRARPAFRTRPVAGGGAGAAAGGGGRGRAGGAQPAVRLPANGRPGEARKRRARTASGTLAAAAPSLRVRV